MKINISIKRNPPEKLMIQKLWIWVDGCFKIQFSFKESFTIIQKSLRFLALSPRKEKKNQNYNKKVNLLFRAKLKGNLLTLVFKKMLTNNIWR